MGQIPQPSYPRPPRRDNEVVAPKYPAPENPTKNKIENTIIIGGKEYVKSKAIITKVKHVASKQHKCMDCESLNITEYCNGQYKEERYYCGSCGKRAEENTQNYCGYCGIKFQQIVEG